MNLKDYLLNTEHAVRNQERTKAAHKDESQL